MVDYKFKHSKEYDTVHFDAPHITSWDLKLEIAKAKQIGKGKRGRTEEDEVDVGTGLGTEFDLVLTYFLV